MAQGTAVVLLVALDAEIATRRDFWQPEVRPAQRLRDPKTSDSRAVSHLTLDDVAPNIYPVVCLLQAVLLSSLVG